MTSFQALPLPPISDQIWRTKYRLTGADGAAETSLAETFARVARAVARAEQGEEARGRWAAAYEAGMADLGFLPAGRILAGAGAERAVTLFNCFVMGPIGDDLGAIFHSVEEAALTMQAGGGVGMDFSTLRPAGAPVRSIGADASGPVSFMDVWDAMCRTIMSAGARRGAMMATLRADHPDIERFIEAKAEPGRLRNFNLSVLVTQAFLAAVRNDADWELKFDGRVYRTVRARDLWQRIMRATYDYAEPGVIFIDRVNAQNNLAYCETISATNPCGEQPLPPYGACLLGSINLAALVERPFEHDATLPLEALRARTGLAVRFLDSAIDVSRYPLPEQRAEAQAKRRIGLGLTGLADALAMLGLRYDSNAGRVAAAGFMAAIQDAAYAASAELAREKGAFPLFDRDAFLAAPNVTRLQPATRDLIARYGIRNGCLTSIAPTGTISLLAGNVSSGIEPIFDLAYRRTVLAADGSRHEETVEDRAYAVFRARRGAQAPLPSAFVCARDIATADHIAMQAALQPHVDSSISKTINVPADLPFEAFEAVYLAADASGLKGCTTYRPNAVTGAVLHTAADTAPADNRTAEGQRDAGGGLPASGARLDAPGVVQSPRTDGAELHGELGAAGPAAPLPRRPLLSRAGDVVYMAKPLERDGVLSGYTYKLKWPASDHAIYVTINDIERDGRRRPFEIFINTRNLEHYAWTVALTRMISAVFRRGGDVSFVADELKAVFDPQGGQWVGGRYVPSLLAAIGDVIEKHMLEIGFLSEAGVIAADDGAGQEAAGRSLPPPVASAGTAAAAVTGSDAASAGVPLRTEAEEGRTTGQRSATGPDGQRRVRFCPRCASPHLERKEGCWVCRDCGFARCS
ncbi:MAG: adenosylcobalamin-dependent ribonucleoside-diphosphate reductase [Hyphomicrobiaceae bacterium]